MLAVLGDYYHASDHLALALMATSVPADLETTVIRYPDPVNPHDLAGYDLLLLSSMGRWRPRESEATWFDADSQQRLERHIASGAGLLLLHSGTASHPVDGPLRAVAGGHFLHHPPEHPPVTVTPTARHPITEGVAPFTHPDEHYFMDVDPHATHLLTAVSSLGEQPAGWCRNHGSGRVAAVIPGHTREMLEEPAFRRLLANAIRWSLGDS